MRARFVAAGLAALLLAGAFGQMRAEAEPSAVLRLGRTVKEGRLERPIMEGAGVKEGRTVYAWALVTGAKGQTMEFVWFEESKVVLVAKREIRTDRSRIWSRLRVPHRKLYPAGGTEWTVELRTLDGVVVSSIGFGVHGPCRRTHDCER